MEAERGDPDGEPGGILGVILAGGRSRRFGGEKALFPLAGEPMASWALRALRSHTARQVVISHLPEVARALDVTRMEDQYPDRGPLGGLHAGLVRAREEGREGVFALACDLPLVGPDLVGRILSAWPAGAPGAIPESPGPLGFEPLCAVYGVECLAGVEEAVLSSGRSMEEVVRRLGAFMIPMEVLGGAEELAVAFTNVNTPASARRAEDLLVAGLPGGGMLGSGPREGCEGDGE
jgi:molybdenum cofactor guanylyltransferase